MSPLAIAVLQSAVRTAAGLVFVQAAIGKLRDPVAFEGVVANYRLLPEALVPGAARVLGPIELVVATALLANVGWAWPAAAAAGLLVAFAAAMAINLLRGRSFIDCGCGRAAARSPLSWGRVGYNMALAALLVVCALGPFQADLAAWAVGAAAGAGAFLLDCAFAAIAGLQPGQRALAMRGRQ